MKLVDLINGVAKGEYSMFDKFIFNNEEYCLNSFSDCCYLSVDNLNNDIELVEDEEEQIKRIEIEPSEDRKGYYLDGSIDKFHTVILANKLNEIIDKLNEMSDNK